MFTTRSRQGSARRRSIRLGAGLAAAALAVLVAPVPSRAHTQNSGLIQGIRLDNGGTPFAGDRRLLTTISPNGDGFRDRARLHFRLGAPATVRLAIETVPTRSLQLVDQRALHLRAGPHTLVWAPPSRLEPGTYVALLSIGVETYGATSSDGAGRIPTPVIRVQGVDAHFTAESYRRGDHAHLVVATDALRLHVVVLHSGPGADPRPTNRDVFGEPMGSPLAASWSGRRNAAHSIEVRVGDWPSGLYFAKVTTDDGRVGYAPLIVRPTAIGEHRAVVVLPTNTWQAYNYEDGNGDGWGDTWYATWSKSATVRLNRHYVGWGIPPHFRQYDLEFLHWLSSTDKAVDFLSDTDLARTESARALAAAYDVVIFPGHHEYVTQREMTLMRRYRDLGGNLMYLSANNFFWHITRHADVLRRTAMWRDLGEPEAQLIGDEYRANNDGRNPKPWRVIHRAAAPWLFAGTGLSNGSTFGLGGIEIDERAPSSPRATKVIAAIPNAIGKHPAEMTYYKTPGGAKVFSAGAFTLAGQATEPVIRDLMQNLWQHLTVP
jgi:hypothetical protein